MGRIRVVIQAEGLLPRRNTHRQGASIIRETDHGILTCEGMAHRSRPAREPDDASDTRMDNTIHESPRDNSPARVLIPS